MSEIEIGPSSLGFAMADCISIILAKTRILREAMRAKGYVRANVNIDIGADGYYFVKLDTNRESVFHGYQFEWMCARKFDKALAEAEAVIEAMPINYPSEAYAPWFTVEPAPQEAAQ